MVNVNRKRNGNTKLYVWKYVAIRTIWWFSSETNIYLKEHCPIYYIQQLYFNNYSILQQGNLEIAKEMLRWTYCLGWCCSDTPKWQVSQWASSADNQEIKLRVNPYCTHLESFKWNKNTLLFSMDFYYFHAGRWFNVHFDFECDIMIYKKRYFNWG